MPNKGFCSVEDQKPSSSLVPFLKFSDLDPTVPRADRVFAHESPAEQEPVWDGVLWRCSLSGRAVSILKKILTSQSGQTKAAHPDGETQRFALDVGSKTQEVLTHT